MSRTLGMWGGFIMACLFAGLVGLQLNQVIVGGDNRPFAWAAVGIFVVQALFSLSYACYCAKLYERDRGQ